MQSPLNTDKPVPLYVPERFMMLKHLMLIVSEDFKICGAPYLQSRASHSDSEDAMG